MLKKNEENKVCTPITPKVRITIKLFIFDNAGNPSDIHPNKICNPRIKLINIIIAPNITPDSKVMYFAKRSTNVSFFFKPVEIAYVLAYTPRFTI